MIIGVITYTMAGMDHLGKNFRVLPDIITYAKEGRLYGK